MKNVDIQVALFKITFLSFTSINKIFLKFNIAKKGIKESIESIWLEYIISSPENINITHFESKAINIPIERVTNKPL